MAPSAVFCESEELLHALYCFPHREAARPQTAADAASLSGLFFKFVQQMLPSGSGAAGGWADQEDAASLAATAWYLESGLVTWFPEFGCAVLARGALALADGDDGAGDLRAQPGQLSLHVLALDEWRFTLHSSPSGAFQHTAMSTARLGGVLFMPCGGTCPPSALTRVIGNVRDIIHRSQDAKIRSNEKGFQRTPAFIHAAVLDALALEVAGGGGTTGTGSWKKTVARGGTTDVGQHTGGDTVRNTCWPLVQATIQVSLLRMGVCGPHQQPNLLFRRAMAHMDLWLLRRQVQCMDSPSAATPVALTATMHMLQATAAKAANLAAEGEDVSTFEKACQSVRQSLEAVASERAWKAAEQHCVPPAGSEAALGELLWPRGTLPGLPPAQLAAGGLEAAKQRESANLGTVPLLEPGASFQKVLGMLQEPLWVQPSGDAAAQLVLRSVEHDLFARVTQLATGRNGGSSSHTAQMSDADLSALTAVVDSYRDALHSFLRTAAAQSVMQCELRSREVLVVWCAYCLAHNAEARRHGLVREYQPALQFADLRHLVLSDRRAVDALLAVAAYLHKQQQCGGPLLFSLRDGGSGTFRFAERFAAADGHLQQILVSERQDADRRQSAHWDKVQQQKRDLQQARQQLAALKAAETCLHEHLVKHDQETTYLQQVQQQLAALEMTQGRLCWQLAQHDRDKTYLQQAQQELAAVRKTEQSLREQLSGAVETTCVWQRQNQRATIARNISTNASQQNQCNYEIARLEKPPEAVLQPLPAADGLARQWLFFLHMPPAFRRLARLSFLAQQVLLPRPLGAWSPELAAVQKAVTVQQPHTSAVQYYNQRRSCRTYLSSAGHQLADGQDGCVKLYADGQLPSHVGPASIELYTSPADGVWHPDSLRPSMLWGGSGSTADSGSGLPSYFNPFAAVNENTIEEFFTERLPDSAAALQWAAHQRISAQATPPERSNWALAGQDACPAELLSKAAFLQFGRMRAYPLQQLRNLCEVLRRQDQALPLTEPAVQVLLRQLLFHVGALTIDSNISTDGARPQLIWRTGWEQPGDVLDTLCSELGALADTLDGKVRDHDAILLLGEMAAYLADWHSPCSAVARRFAAIAMLEADRMQVELDAAAGLAADDRRVSELLARLVRWRVMALLCYGAGPLSPAAAGRGARQQQSKDAATMVRLMVQVCHGLTFQTDRAMQQELELLRTRAHNVMASRVQRLGELLTSEDLTAAVASVLERTPDSLLWQRLSQAQQLTACYRAEGADGRLYSINILDGTVLFDGWPPSRLPKDITQHPLYKRTFGNFNFEVAFTGGASSASQGGGAVVLQTLRKVRGRRYDFRLCAAAGGKQQQLVITEMDVEHGDERLELLDAGPDSSCEGWGEQLPVRLRELHSHWLSRQRGVLVLRPRSFQEHDCMYVITCMSIKSSGSVGGSLPVPVNTATQCAYSCWRVPRHSQSWLWRQLLLAAPPLLVDRLVLPQGSKLVDNILAKFEEPRFIHTFLSVSSEVSFELPRCGLEFSMQRKRPGSFFWGGGDACCQLISRNYTGYRLRRLQLLAECCGVSGSAAGACGDNGSNSSSNAAAAAARGIYTLPEFRQYLVLERIPQPAVASMGGQRADVLVLVPAGAVQSSLWEEGSGGKVAVSVTLPSGSQASVNFHCYEVHGRFGHLRAPNRLARLQLAALYAATSTLLPEPGSRCTGAQMAMELLRQCWSTRPLEAAEAEQLAAVGRLGGHLAPGLHLLAHDLAASAVQLAHLHAVPADKPAAAAADGPGAAGGGDIAARFDAQDTAIMPRLCADHAQAYEELQRSAHAALPPGWGAHPRLLLTPVEEERTVGVHVPREPLPAWHRLRQFEAIAALGEALPLAVSYVEDTEAELQDLLLPPAPAVDGASSQAMPPYPLSAAARVRQRRHLEAEMHAELEDSWNAHHLQRDLATYSVKPGCLDRVRAMQATTSRHRRNLEAHLLHQLMHVPESVGCHGASIRLLRAAATAPAAGPLDLARVAVRPELVNEFNPFLSPEAAQELQRRVRLWLRLCVLEDRLGRIVALAAARRAEGDCLPQLVQELSVHRTWDAAAHPEWLVFEVESQLQIRPQQHTVARMLMEGGDGPIAQLNMGEGKTRVILPMLLLALADGKRVVSLTFLSTLLDEAYAYLHGALCAGVLGRKLFTMPFQRDIELTPARAMRMRAALAHCMRERGVLLLAPEHRLSLELKWKEYLLQLRQASVPAAAGTGSNGGDVEALLAAVLKTPVLSILDESDELLHHRFQLIYACGGRVPLVSFEARTGAMRAVLGAVAQLANSGQLQLPHSTRVLEPPPAVDPTDAECSVGSAAVPAGAFCGLRLLPGPDLEAALPAFHHQLARHVLDHPPFEFQKLTKLLDEGSKVRVMTCITDADTDAETALGAELLDKLAGGVLHSFVLALRGLLGCGLLRHGLTLRHNVEYGIDRRTAAAGVRTRMAVPYRAAHTPSERSEFAQPDVSLLLTHLAYRYDGLTLPEFTAAVERLLHGLGKEAAADHYREWLVLSAESIPKEELSRFKDVNQLDASSGSQMAAMHRHLRRNTAVVDFWLRFCVLPAETRQYPQRLGASAWDLAAAGGRVMGFSGTNDNYRLLPLRVRQAAAEDPALKATNGKMLSVLLQNTHGFHTLPPAEDAGGVAVWQSLLQMALDKSAHALIDCGALLAGTTNRHAAEFLLADPRLQQLGFRGVTFYAERERGWAVLELTGRCLPRSSSPLQEHETFVIYDEARCRGADLKLKRNAVALLTLGPRVCKDKLMQAAGRLRQLGRGQALRFAATADIAARVTLLPAWLSARVTLLPAWLSTRVTLLPPWLSTAAPASAGGTASSAAGACPRAVDVLAWVMGNTVDANLHGVALWAAQGLQFATALGAPQLSLQEEVLGLEELYAGSKAPRPVVAVVAAAAAKQLRWRQKQCGSSAGGTAAGGRRMYTAAELMVEIQDLAARYGEGHTVRAGSGADDTCERELELEQEEEEEQEQERQVPKQRPAPEADWSSYRCINSSTMDQLTSETRCRLLPLRDAVTRLDSQDPAQPMAALPWSDKVYVSHNYLHAIAGLPPGQPLNEYLRPVGWLLVLKRGEVLLLSEREADQLLAATWADAPAAKGTTSFRHRLVRYLADTASKRGPLLVSQAYAWQAAAVSSATRPLLVTDLGLTTAGIVQDAADAWAELRRRLGVRELVSVRVFAGETSYRVTRLAGANGTAASSGSAATAAVEAELQRLVAGRRPQVQQLLVMRGRQSQMARSDLEKAVEGLQLQL